MARYVWLCRNGSLCMAMIACRNGSLCMACRNGSLCMACRNGSLCMAMIACRNGSLCMACKNGSLCVAELNLKRLNMILRSISIHLWFQKMQMMLPFREIITLLQQELSKPKPHLESVIFNFIDGTHIHS